MEYTHVQSFLNKYVKRVELIVFLIVVLIIVGFGAFTQKKQNIGSDAAGTTQELTSQYGLTIAGYVYLDQNQNGERDLEETGVSGGVIQIRPSSRSVNQGNLSTDVRTDSYGYFKYTTSPPLGAVNFSLTLIPPPSYKVTTQNPISRYGLSGRAKRIVEFGITDSGNPLPSPTTIGECTADAKRCPDGSSVGRVPPTCEFAPCPSGPTPSCVQPPPCVYSEPFCGGIAPPPGGWCLPFPTIVVNECVWCGSACVNGPLQPGQNCNMALPPNGYVCKRDARTGTCRAIKVTATSGVICPKDAKRCPDGSTVGRFPPTCEFDVCPSLVR